MKPLRLVLVLALLVLLLGGGLYARSGLQIATGYSAKQMCSGVFVAGLPEGFVREVDVLPRMAILGPARSWLNIRVDRAGGFAEASLAGVATRAVHRVPEGCVLFGDGPGLPPRAPVPTPQSAGVPGELVSAFDEAFAEPRDGGRNTLALVVSLAGEILAERYADPVSPASPMQGWSMNKSLMATWIGMQAASGDLDPGLPVTVLDPSLPRADAPAAAGVDGRLTLLHLLQMESGIDFGEIYGIGGDATRMLYRTPAMWTVPANLGNAYAPGEHFAYSSGDTNLASYLWQRSLGEPYTDWIERNFREPLGLSTLVAEPDASGVQVGSSYAYLTTRDWLRVGQEWLDAWHGRSPLLPRDWLRDSVAPRPSDPAGRYGRGFWLNTGGVAFPALPENAFYASGNAGQYVIVVPGWELVVVRLGLTDAASSTGIGDFLREVAALHSDRRLETLSASTATPPATPAQPEVSL